MIDIAEKLEDEQNKILEKINILKNLKMKYIDDKNIWTKEKIEELEKLEKENLKSNEVWVFFDEFNTSILQDYIAEIMLKRRSSLIKYNNKVYTYLFILFYYILSYIFIIYFF